MTRRTTANKKGAEFRPLSLPGSQPVRRVISRIATRTPNYHSYRNPFAELYPERSPFARIASRIATRSQDATRAYLIRS